MAGALAGAAAGPAALTGIANAMGFTAAGIKPNSKAAGMMAATAVAHGGRVMAGSMVAQAQAIGAARLSVGMASAAGFGGAVLGAAVIGGSGAVAIASTGYGGSGMPNGQQEDPGDGMWLLVTEEGWGNIVFYPFTNERDARSAMKKLTMPRVLFNHSRQEVEHGGLPLGCNTIRGHVTAKSPAFVCGHWMVVTEEGSGNVCFYPFTNELNAIQFYESLFGSRPRILFDPAANELRSGGWNLFALSTIRTRVMKSRCGVPAEVREMSPSADGNPHSADEGNASALRPRSGRSRARIAAARRGRGPSPEPNWDRR